MNLVETATADAHAWIERGLVIFADDMAAFYRVVDNPAAVAAGAHEGARRFVDEQRYKDEFAATVRQATRGWPSAPVAH